MRESRINGRPVLVLRESRPLPPASPEPHKCVVTTWFQNDWRYTKAVAEDNGAIIQCSCGRRYRCRKSRSIENEYVWVRRLLPWPPRQKGWP